MEMNSPPNLTVSTVHLSDKPYEVQLEVLRWLRDLVFDVVDKAIPLDLLVSSPASHLQQLERDGRQDPQAAAAAAAAAVNADISSTVVAAEESAEHVRGDINMLLEKKEQQQQQGKFSVNVESSAVKEGILVHENNQANQEVALVVQTINKPAGVSSDLEQSEGEGGGEGKARKRRRTLSMLERGRFAVGSVVECFFQASPLFFPLSHLLFRKSW